MWENYGDRNFFECGLLVNTDYSEIKTEFQILYCRPYSDVADKYLFSECVVDITDNWIDKEAVMSYIGMSENDFDSIPYAIGCIYYYGYSNFNSYSLYGTTKSKREIKKILEYFDISLDNVVPLLP